MIINSSSSEKINGIGTYYLRAHAAEGSDVFYNASVIVDLTNVNSIKATLERTSNNKSSDTKFRIYKVDDLSTDNYTSSDEVYTQSGWTSGTTYTIDTSTYSGNYAIQIRSRTSNTNNATLTGIIECS